MTGLLARGPWETSRVSARWRDDCFDPRPETSAAADAAIDALRERGSPSHDGMSARLAGFAADRGALRLELQPARWSLRLVEDEDAWSLAAQCIARAADGRWLAGRRAPWVATWAGRWTLGAGGAVEVGEDPVATLGRELEEEWSVRPRHLSVEALVRPPSRLVLLLGMAWLEEGAEVSPDSEHDAFAWWPADPACWPEEAGVALRRTASLVAG